jgi:hypothetical protein
MPLPQRSASFNPKCPPNNVAASAGGLSGFGDDEVYEPRRNVKRNKSAEMQRAVKSLEYSDADVELIAHDARQFEVLKQSLRKKGAVTNEVLKQKLPLFIKFKKDRLAETHPEVHAALRQLPSRSNNLSGANKVERMSQRKPVNRLLTEEEKYEAGAPDASTVSAIGRMFRPGTSAKSRGAPARAKSYSPSRTKANALSNVQYAADYL